MIEGERFNTLSHLLGAIAACAGVAVLVVLAARDGDAWKIISFSVYGLTLILVYTFSTLYHGLQGRSKKICRKLDHLSIYLLIAGTYTPFTLVTLRGIWGWSLFGAEWGLAVLGISLEMLPQDGRRILSVVIYLVMGWMILVALEPLSQVLPPAGFAWLLAGGLFYTGGVIFYALDKKVRYFHNVWHLFVLAGSVSHYCAVLLYVA
jgi:hemolysin III